MEDFHKIWQHRWLNPKTEVRKSRICARGLFAREFISKGEILRVTGGVVVPKSDIEKYNKLMDYVVDNIPLDIDENFLMAPTPEDLELTATINHACDPNAGFRDTITIIAIEDIEPDVEIAWDYAFSQTCFDPFKCNCKSRACRELITPSDWQRPDIFQKYGRYYSPYLKAKIPDKYK